MERWNSEILFLRMLSILNFFTLIHFINELPHSGTARNSSDRPKPHYTETHDSNFPDFQHANRTTLRLSTGWGEAPKSRSHFSGI
jgi:hypothetical protein